MRLEATVPYAAPMNTSATRRHWAVAHRERQTWQHWIAWAFPTFRRPILPWARACVTVTRITASGRHPDVDNLHFAAKPLLDALVSLGILADDGPKVERVMRWERGPRGRPQTRITIEPL